MPPEKAKSFFDKLRDDLASGRAEKEAELIPEESDFTPRRRESRGFTPRAVAKGPVTFVDRSAQALARTEEENERRSRNAEGARNAEVPPKKEMQLPGNAEK